MSETQKTATTIRATARQAVIDSVPERAALEHARNYHKLHIWRDGAVSWSEHINRSDDIIDSGAKHFAAVPSVACVGTGSYACDCDYCNEIYDADNEARAAERGEEYDKDAKYSTTQEAIDDAVSNSDLSDVEDAMLAEFDEIEVGYFDDEDADEAH